MSIASRALIFSYSDSLFYFVGTTEEAAGSSDAVRFFKDDYGNLLKFRSLLQAKTYLFNQGYTQGALVIHSAYDEMIGNEPAQKAEMPWLFDGAVA